MVLMASCLVFGWQRNLPAPPGGNKSQDFRMRKLTLARLPRRPAASPGACSGNTRWMGKGRNKVIAPYGMQVADQNDSATCDSTF
jgi:hypothetical protein